VINTVASVLLLLTPPTSPSAYTGGPRSFISNLYLLESHRQFADFSIFLTPKLSAAVVEDREKHEGEVGKLDFDPICDCQDAEDLHFKITHINKTGNHASAIVSLTFSDSSTRTVRLELLKISGRWAINDIGTKEFASLRAFLTQP
jgi:hypothetical protein